MPGIILIAALSQPGGEGDAFSGHASGVSNSRTWGGAETSRPS